jgi:MbtH protein
MSEDYRDWQDGKLKVVKNTVSVCSIWPADRPTPSGWEEVGFSGMKEQCLEFVKTHCDSNCRLVVDPAVGIESTPAS